MKNRGNGTLDIYENVATLKKPLHLVADLIEFFSEEFIEVMIHNDSKETRERLRAIRTAIINDLDKLLNILSIHELRHRCPRLWVGFDRPVFCHFSSSIFSLSSPGHAQFCCRNTPALWPAPLREESRGEAFGGR